MSLSTALSSTFFTSRHLSKRSLHRHIVINSLDSLIADINLMIHDPTLPQGFRDALQAKLDLLRKEVLPGNKRRWEGGRDKYTMDNAEYLAFSKWLRELVAEYEGQVDMERFSGVGGTGFNIILNMKRFLEQGFAAIGAHDIKVVANLFCWWGKGVNGQMVTKFAEDAGVNVKRPALTEQQKNDALTAATYFLTNSAKYGLKNDGKGSNVFTPGYVNREISGGNILVVTGSTLAKYKAYDAEGKVITNSEHARKILTMEINRALIEGQKILFLLPTDSRVFNDDPLNRAFIEGLIKEGKFDFIAGNADELMMFTGDNKISEPADDEQKEAERSANLKAAKNKMQSILNEAETNWGVKTASTFSDGKKPVISITSKRIKEHPVPDVAEEHKVSVNGAGDTFTALTFLIYSMGASLDDAIEIGNAGGTACIRQLPTQLKKPYEVAAQTATISHHFESFSKTIGLNNNLKSSLLTEIALS